MSIILRQSEIHQRRKRRAKLTKLREQYGEATSTTDKEKILAKASRIAPWVKQEEFTKPRKKA